MPPEVIEQGASPDKGCPCAQTRRPASPSRACPIKWRPRSSGRSPALTGSGPARRLAGLQVHQGDAVLDGARGHQADRARAAGRHLVRRLHHHRDGHRQAALEPVQQPGAPVADAPSRRTACCRAAGVPSVALPEDFLHTWVYASLMSLHPCAFVIRVVWQVCSDSMAMHTDC